MKLRLIYKFKDGFNQEIKLSDTFKTNTDFLEELKQYTPDQEIEVNTGKEIIKKQVKDLNSIEIFLE